MGLLSAVPMDVLAMYRKNVSPGSKIGVALIGCNGMGWVNLTSMLKIPDTTCVALCDIDDSVLKQRLEELDKLNIKPTTFKDYRKLLEMKEVDVVIIATPDHWHCLMMVEACAAGKAVYVEKPAANSIVEANIMVAAAQRYGSIVQVNQWQRSQQHFKDAIAFVQSGKLGTISQTKTWMFSSHGLLAPKPDAPVPAGVDYKMWLGPAKERTYNRNRFHYTFRWYWDYAGGLMTDWGVHLVDMVLLGMQTQAPKSIASIGGHFAYPTDDRETPDTQTAQFSFDTFQMSWDHSMGNQNGFFNQGHGISFGGSNGTLILNRGGWEVRPEKEKDKPKMDAVSWQNVKDNGVDLHTANFINAVKAKNASLLNCPIEAGAAVAKVCQMGNVALRSKEMLHWNNASQKFDSKTANEFLAAEYHNGWKLPKV